jgi:hypothetical protein
VCFYRRSETYPNSSAVDLPTHISALPQLAGLAPMIESM